jgi:DNA/RNA-binding domain of Phe-tRNA-synthetase-like protein
MQFRYASDLRGDYPELVTGVLFAPRVNAAPVQAPQTAPLLATALARLGSGTESELPEIQAWRRTFAKMGLKPTQYRCASEQLLRRFRQDKGLPSIHPLVDLCNAASLAFAIPIAVFDAAKIAEFQEVRYATGDETYQTFSGETEQPHPREVIFADAARRAHARRWTNRQSGYSAVRADTAAALIVAEAMHASASADMRKLVATLAATLKSAWATEPMTGILEHPAVQFEF